MDRSAVKERTANTAVRSGGIVPASRGERLLAFVMDGPVVWILTFLLGGPLNIRSREEASALAFFVFAAYVIPLWRPRWASGLFDPHWVTMRSRAASPGSPNCGDS